MAGSFTAAFPFPVEN